MAEKAYKKTKKEYSRWYRKNHPDKVLEYNRETSDERSSRNKARRIVAKRVGKAAIKGKSIHHVNKDPKDNGSGNLRIAKKHHSNEGAGKGNKNAVGRHGKR